jgi:hypothetical protein
MRTLFGFYGARGWIIEIAGASFKEKGNLNFFANKAALSSEIYYRSDLPQMLSLPEGAARASLIRIPDVATCH